MRNIITKAEFEALGSAYTICGVGGEIGEWTKGYADMLVDEKIIPEGFELTWVTWTGKEINEAFKLQDENEFQDDLTFLAFELNSDKMNIGKLAMFKIGMRDRWLDDLIANSI